MTTERDIQRLQRAVGASTPAKVTIPVVPPGIVEFVTDLKFLRLDLFPRQGTWATPHPFARAELEHLTRQGDRILAPTTGPVQTKDLADAIINVVYTLLHERMDDVYVAFWGVQLRGSVQGGIIPIA